VCCLFCASAAGLTTSPSHCTLMGRLLAAAAVADDGDRGSDDNDARN